MIFLQTVSQYKELLHICTQILSCVQMLDPATAFLLQQEVITLRWRLAEISLQASALRTRVQNLISKF